MRPVTIPGVPANYPEATLKAKDINRTVNGGMEEELATSVVTGDQKGLINQWLTNNLAWVVPKVTRLLDSGDPAKNGKDNDLYNADADSLKAVEGYRDARRDLVSAIGGYCSYCELPLSSSLAIEHRLPKSWFPDSMLSWDNFLLACPICNSIKNNSPDQNYDGTYQQTDAAAAALQTYYAWPNLYAQWVTGVIPLFPVTFTLNQYAYAHGNWTLVGTPTKEEVDELVTKYDQGLGMIHNNLFGFADAPNQNPGAASFSYYALAVKGRPTGVVDLNTKIDRIIDMTGLNTMRNQNDQQVSDLRVAYRTQTYFRARSLRKAYNTAVEGDASAANSILAAMIKAMAASGFWTIWSTVFTGVPGARTGLQDAFPGTVSKGWFF